MQTLLHELRTRASYTNFVARTSLHAGNTHIYKRLMKKPCDTTEKNSRYFCKVFVKGVNCVFGRLVEFLVSFLLAENPVILAFAEKFTDLFSHFPKRIADFVFLFAFLKRLASSLRVFLKRLADFIFTHVLKRVFPYVCREFCPYVRMS